MSNATIIVFIFNTSEMRTQQGVNEQGKTNNSRSNNNSRSHSGCAMTYNGFVHVCPLIEQQLHHFGMTIPSSTVEMCVATILKCPREKKTETPTWHADMKGNKKGWSGKKEQCDKDRFCFISTKYAMKTPPRVNEQGSYSNNNSCNGGCAMTYCGVVHICPLLQQQLHHVDMTLPSSTVERGPGEKEEKIYQHDIQTWMTNNRYECRKA